MNRLKPSDQALLVEMNKKIDENAKLQTRCREEFFRIIKQYVPKGKHFELDPELNQQIPCMFLRKKDCAPATIYVIKHKEDDSVRFNIETDWKGEDYVDVPDCKGMNFGIYCEDWCRALSMLLERLSDNDENENDPE